MVRGVGTYNRDRELRQMRARYVGAVRRFDVALRTFDDSGMPMAPGPGAEPYPWTRRHVEILTEVRDAATEILDARRTWDAFRRERHGMR